MSTCPRPTTSRCRGSRSRRRWPCCRRPRSRQVAAGSRKGRSARRRPEADGSATYTVKAGDTLAKIARETKTPIDQLKAANGIKDGGIRIGQTLKVGSSASDNVKTASIPQTAPAAPAAQPKAEPVAAKPNTPAPASVAAEKPAAQTASLTDVEKKSDVNVAAPSATGIGKYRWPVTGAVIASYGQNVEGSRNDGINISVPEGTPIKAAENGVVIYAATA